MAAHISQSQKGGTPLVVVVSAMGNETNELKNLAESILSPPPPRELDMLLTIGERKSMALLSMALHKLGCASRSFTGSLRSSS